MRIATITFFAALILFGPGPRSAAASPVAVGIEWYQFDRAAISSSATDSVDFTMKLTGAPTSVQIDLQAGGSLPLTTTGDGIWTTRLSAPQALFDYSTDDVNHNFVGFAISFEGSVQAFRFNMFINVTDENVPTVPVEDLSGAMRRSGHAVNIWKPDLTYPPSGAQVQEITQTFYQELADVFDFINVVFTLPSYQANRFHFAVKNDIQGLGLTVFDNTGLYGSTGRLLGINQYPIDTFFDMAEKASLHELGHQWINFCDLPLLQPGAHWPVGTLARGIMGFNGVSGQGLTFPYELVPLPGGDYQMQSAPALQEFTDLDLYLMGLLPAGDVGSNFVFSNPDQEICNGCSGPITWFTVDDVIAAQGPRIPDASSSPKTFRVATLVITRDRLLDDDEMAMFDHLSLRGESMIPLPFSSGFSRGTANPFYVATGGRGSLNTSVTDPTPVRVLSFTASLNLAGVLLDWETSSETNHAGFYVYRRSVGVSSWRKITDRLIIGGPKYSYSDPSPEAGYRYQYEIESVSRTGETERFGPVGIQIPRVTGFTLRAAPNPATGAISIYYTLPDDGPVSIRVFNLSGRLMRVLVDSFRSAGPHETNWNAEDDSGRSVAAGVYFLRFDTGAGSRVQRITITK